MRASVATTTPTPNPRRYRIATTDCATATAAWDDGNAVPREDPSARMKSVSERRGPSGTFAGADQTYRGPCTATSANVRKQIAYVVIDASAARPNASRSPWRYKARGGT